MQTWRLWPRRLRFLKAPVCKSSIIVNLVPQYRDVTYHIQKWLRQVAVQFRQAVGEFGDVDSNHLVGIFDPIIQRRNAIKGQLGQVLVVYMLC